MLAYINAFVEPFVPPLYAFLAILGLAVITAAHHFYKYLISFPPRKEYQFFDRKSATFDAYRRSTFPPPYPNGWWRICAISDLDNGRVHSVSALGHDWVVFKGKDGRVGILDAFCPHIGAHLGQGGKIVDGTLQCPFHGWQFDTDGACKAIPYCTGAIPSSARTKAYESCLWMDQVFVWIDAEGRAPLYKLTPPAPDSPLWEYCGCYQSFYDMHCSEMAENSADYFHFNYLHKPLPVPIVGRFFEVHHDTELYFPEEPEKSQFSYFDNWAEVYFLGKYRLSFTRQKTVVTFEGPSIVHFHIETPLGAVHLIKTNLQLEPFKLFSEDRWYKEKKVPGWLLRIVSTIARGALEQDRVVWENKRYNSKPHLVKGDGPFPAHRRWFRQFYSENSRNIGKKDVLDW